MQIKLLGFEVIARNSCDHDVTVFIKNISPVGQPAIQTLGFIHEGSIQTPSGAFIFQPVLPGNKAKATVHIDGQVDCIRFTSINGVAMPIRGIIRHPSFRRWEVDPEGGNPIPKRVRRYSNLGLRPRAPQL